MSPIRPLVRDLIRDPVRLPTERRGGWTPAVLFAGGVQGAFYEFGDLSTEFQDAAGTTPVTATTQPMGRINDKSGRGNNATQGTTTSRPLLVQPTTYYAARADGVDDSLATTTGGGGSAGILLCAAITVNGGAAATRSIWSDAGTNTGYIVRIDTSNRLNLIAGDGVGLTTAATVATLPVGETHVVTVWDDGANLNAQIDNGAVASIGRPAVSAGTAATSLFAASGTQFLPGDCHALVYVKDSAKTAAERTLLKRWVGARAGVFL